MFAPRDEAAHLKAKAHIGIFLLTLVLFGCTVRHVPEISSLAPGQVPDFRPAGPVKLVNAQPSSENSISPLPPGNLSVNYREYTDSALELIRKEISNRGGMISGNAPKVIKLAITNIRIESPPSSFTCIINYTIETGDRYLRQFQVTSSNWNVYVAIDNCVANVAISVLNNKNVLSYLEKY